MTHTRTHVYVSFANPYLVCDLCRQPVPRWHNNDKCGCAEECWLDPCSHNVEAVSVCPSWSPVDGCLCQEHLGRVDHTPTGPASDLPGFIAIAQYHRDNGGHLAYAARCWGTDACDGWLSLDHFSEDSATRAVRRHLALHHPETGGSDA